MSDNGFSWLAARVAIAAVKCQAVMDRDVTRANLQRLRRPSDVSPLIRRKHGVVAAPKLARECLELSDEAPLVAPVNDVETTILDRSIREGESNGNNSRGIKITGIGVVLMQSDGPVLLRGLQEQRFLQQPHAAGEQHTPRNLRDSIAQVIE